MNESIVVLLAGGSGTRLWPLSRGSFPKQLLKIRGDKSLLQQTALTLLKKVSADSVYTLTSVRCASEVREQFREIDPDLVKNVLSEPSVKNTLPAIAWIAQMANKKNPQTLLSVFTSDQFFSDEAAFLNAWDVAKESACRGKFTIFGNTPTKAATEFGYIKKGKKSLDSPTYDVLEFREKPDRETAEKYFSSGEYLWNAGIFVFRAGDFVRELKKIQPQIFELSEKIASQSAIAADASLYDQFPNVSIDHGLVEKLSEITVVPLQAGWHDVGNLKALYELGSKDKQKNVSHGDVVAVDSQNNLFWSSDGLIAAYGVKDVLLVRTEDVTLICPKDKASEVKSLVSEVGRQHESLVTNGVMEHRPWGLFRVLHQEPGYKVKMIAVKPGGSLSKQYHHKRAEHWTVVQGEASIELGDKSFILRTNESIHIPCGEPHRLSNTTENLLKVIEVQVGQYLGEDDIVRIEDKYGRVAKNP